MSTATTATGKLGKLPVRTDVRTLRIARYVDGARLPAPPERLDLAARVAAWPMYANDSRGDCTTAAAAHMVEAWTGASRGEPAVISEASVLRAFERIKIVDPFTGDEGAFALDVLRMWRGSGIGRHRIGAFARVAAYDQRLVRAAAWLFGGLYVGLALPLTARTQRVWEWTGTLGGDAKPGSWGGHAVDVVRYDRAGLTVVTWGRLQRLTWSFWERYCDEAYCALSTDFVEHGRAPNGFDLEALRADLALVTA
jgi:hypothetical protein